MYLKISVNYYDAAATTTSVLPPASRRDATANDAALPPRCQAGCGCRSIPTSVDASLSLPPRYPRRHAIPVALLPRNPQPLPCYPAAAGATALPPP
jgi:hypothetical protein